MAFKTNSHSPLQFPHCAMVISGASSPKMMPDIVSVYDMQENKMKLKLNSNILSEIMILRENGGCGESLAQISNFHIYMGIAA